jgi:hypothetical protein
VYSLTFQQQPLFYILHGGATATLAFDCCSAVIRQSEIFQSLKLLVRTP